MQDKQKEDVRIILVCSLCLRQYSLKEDLRGHMIEYHKYEPIEAPVQNTERLPTNELIKTIAPTALEAVPQIKVRRIKLQSKTIENIHNNLENSKNEETQEMRPVPFKDFRILLRSMMVLRCTVRSSCPYKFQNEDKLELHIKCHIESDEIKFKCYECGLEFANWRRCSAHLWKVHHNDVDLVRCPLCSFPGHASALVWRHMRVHKKWRPRVLRSLRAVQQRRKESKQKESEAKPSAPPANKNKYYAEKTCEICNRKFVNGKTLSKHVKAIHHKIKPFICNICGRKTTRKASLIVHMRQHTGEKPLQCKTCKFATRDPSVLHKHQLRHEKGKKFKCALCAYECIQTTAYKRHLKLNHTEEYKKISCDLCNFATISAEKLEAHKEDHKKGLIVVPEDSMDATRAGNFKNPGKQPFKNNEMSADCFMPLESIDSLPHEPAVDTGGVTIPAPPSEDTQFPTYLNL